MNERIWNNLVLGMNMANNNNSNLFYDNTVIHVISSLLLGTLPIDKRRMQKT
jgi:hypothetical protein